MMIKLLLAVFGQLIWSGLCSGTEAALFSSNTMKIKQLADEGSTSAKVLLKIKENMNPAIIAIVIQNNIANIVGTVVATAIATSVFGSTWIGIFSGVLTGLVILFSEIIPKTLGAHFWRQLAPMTGLALKYLIILFYPFVKLSALLTRQI